MKKKTISLILILAIFVCIFAFAACNDPNGKEDLPSGETPSGSISSGDEQGGEISDNNSDSVDTLVSVNNVDWSDDNADYTRAFNTDGNGKILSLTDYGKTLSKINIPESINGETITKIGEYAFCDKVDNFHFNITLTAVKIPNTVTSIESEAFGYCFNLMSIEIPNTVLSIDSGAFVLCNKLTIYCEAENKAKEWDEEWNNFNEGIYCPTVWNCKSNEVAEDGYIYCRGGNGIFYAVKDGEATITIQNCNLLADYEIEVGNNFLALSGDIVIPSSVTYKGNTYTVNSIDTWAFYDCRNLTSVAIPNSIMSIGYGAFSYCSSLTSIEIPSSVTSIGEQAFYKCSSLTSIEIPSSVTSIGEYAFDGCSSLTRVTFGENSKLESIGYGAFSNCSSLTSIEIPSSVTSIDSNAFSFCSSLTSIEIPSSVTSIGWNAFSGCSSLTSIVIPSSVTSIGSSAFYKCSSLTSIEIPSSVTSIGSEAFSGCSNLQYNEFDNALYLGNRDNPYLVLVKAKNKDITSCTINANTRFIHSHAFSGCSALTSIEIPSSVTSIGSKAFWYCSSLTSIEIPSSVTSIGRYAFYKCSSLTSIEIPSNVTSIGEYAFLGCSSLTIYCEVSESDKPSGWNSKWNSSNCPVVWGYNG